MSDVTTTSTPCTECGVYEGAECRHTKGANNGSPTSRRQAKANRPRRAAPAYDGVLGVRETVDADTLPFGTE